MIAEQPNPGSSPAESSVPKGPHDIAATEVVRRFRWSLTQVAVLAVGVFWAALGGIGLARIANVGIDSPIDPQIVVAAWTRTPLMAALELAIGITLLVAGAQKVTPTAAYRFMGATAIAFGVVLAAAPEVFDMALGAGRNSGWLYIALGAVLVAVGFGSPLVFERDVITPGSVTKS